MFPKPERLESAALPPAPGAVLRRVALMVRFAAVDVSVEATGSGTPANWITPALRLDLGMAFPHLLHCAAFTDLSD